MMKRGRIVRKPRPELGHIVEANGLRSSKSKSRSKRYGLIVRFPNSVVRALERMADAAEAQLAEARTMRAEMAETSPQALAAHALKTRRYSSAQRFPRPV